MTGLASGLASGLVPGLAVVPAGFAPAGFAPVGFAPVGFAPSAVDDFLAEAQGSDGWTSPSTALALVGVLIAAGLAVFALAVIQRDAPRPVVATVAVAAVAGGVGAMLEVQRVADQAGSTWGQAVSDAAAAGAILRLVASLALAIGAVQWLADDRRGLVSAGPFAAALLAGGTLATWFSFAFDGHTLSRGPEVMHRLASIVHAVAGSVWAGGVIGLAIVALAGNGDPQRRRRIVDTMIRFSPIATVALVAVAVVGAVMSYWIVAELSDYFTTTWGRLLVVKLVGVAIAVVFGAYHQRRLIPALAAAPDDIAIVERATRSLATEAAVLVAVVVVTGLLVSASVI